MADTVQSDDEEPFVIIDDDAAISVAPHSPDAAPGAQPQAVPQPPPPSATPASASGPGLIFVQEDRQQESCIFQAGPIRLSIDSRDGAGTKRRVTLRCNGKTSQDHLDLAVLAQRQRFAGGAARRLGQPAETITSLLAELLTAVQAREAERERGQVIPISPADRTAGLALLESPDLLEQVVADCTALGWIGDDRTKKVLYLASVSRLLPKPVWCVYQASAGGTPWQGIGCIAALMPPEALTLFNRLTESSLAHAAGASLRHKLVIVDQAETLRPEAALAIRVLHERGGIGWATASTGSVSMAGEARGPVTVLAAATGPLDPRCRDAFLTITVDESPQQTEAVLADQRRLLAAGVPDDSVAARVIARHRVAHRLLESLPVRIPFADRIIFPATRVQHRDEQRWLLGLIAAHALLHQRQRQRVDGAIIADEADFAAVVACTAGIIGVTAKGITPAARRLLETVFERKLASFTMVDLTGLLPDWTSYAFRSSVRELLDFGHIDSPRSGRGRLREYRLAARTADTAPIGSGIRLRPVDAPTVSGTEAASAQVDEFAKVREMHIANFIHSETGT